MPAAQPVAQPVMSPSALPLAQPISGKIAVAPYMPYGDSDEAVDPLSGKIAINPSTETVERQESEGFDFQPSQLMPAVVFKKGKQGKQALYQALGEKSPS